MFETARLVLRAVDLESDLPALVQALNDAELRSMASTAPLLPKTKEQVKAFFAPRPTGSLPVFIICQRPASWPLNLNAEDDYFKACRPLEF